MKNRGFFIGIIALFSVTMIPGCVTRQYLLFVCGEQKYEIIPGLPDGRNVTGCASGTFKVIEK